MRTRLAFVLAGLLAGCVVSNAPTPAPSPTAAASTGAAVIAADAVVPVGGAPVAIAAAGSYVFAAIAGATALTMIDTRDNDASGRLDLGGAQVGTLRAFLDRRQLLAIDEARSELLVLDVGLPPPAPSVEADPNAPRPSGTPPDAPSPTPGRPSVLHRLPIGPGVGSFAFYEDNLSVLLAPDAAGNLERLTFPDDRRLPPTRTRWTLGGAGVTGKPAQVDFKGDTWIAPRVDRLMAGDAKGVTRELAPYAGGGPIAIGRIAGKAAVAIALDPAKDVVLLIDLATGQATPLADAGKGPRELVVDHEMARAYVSMGGSNEVVVIDYAAKSVLTRLPAGAGPGALTFAAPVPNEVWVASDDGRLTVIDGAGAMPKVKATRPLGKGGHRLTFWGSKGYVTNEADGTVSVLDRTTMR